MLPPGTTKIRSWRALLPAARRGAVRPDPEGPSPGACIRAFLVTLALATGFLNSTCGESPSTPAPSTPLPPLPPPLPPNRAPTVAQPIPDVALERERPQTLDVAASFVDPDGNRLTYAVSSSDPLTVGASVAGSVVTLTPLRAGTVAVTVTATDPAGLSASQEFTVTVAGGNPPVVSQQIPDQVLTAGGSPVIVNLDQYFSDDDGDALDFEATSSDSTVVRVLVAGSELVLIPLTDGSVDVTVRATGPGGLGASQTFGVTVGPENRPPVAVGEIPDQSLEPGGEASTLDVSLYFDDPGDTLTYTAESSDSSVVRALVAEAGLVLIPLAAGSATVTVTATDTNGLHAASTFEVTVGARNRAPVSTSLIPDQRLAFRGGSVRVDLTAHFSDPDGDPLTFGAVSDSRDIVRAEVSGADLILTPVHEGTGTVEVTATDPGALSASQTVRVSIAGVPRPPTGLRVEAAGRDFIEWRWDAVSGAIRYAVEIARDEAFTFDPSIHFVDGTSYRVTGLPPGTRVFLRVLALGGTADAPLESPWTAPVAGTTTRPPDDHGDDQRTATRVAVPSITPGELEIATDLDFFRFEVPWPGVLTVYTTGRTDTAGRLTGPNGLAKVNDDSGEGRNFRLFVRDASPGTYYVLTHGFRVAVGRYELHVTLTPTAPGGLHVTDAGANFIEWSWDLVEGAFAYEVQVRRDRNFSDSDPADGTGSTFYRALNLPAGTRHYLRVRAVASTARGRVVSDWSSPVSATTAGIANTLSVPANLRVTDDDEDSIEWSWDDVPGADEYETQLRRDTNFTEGDRVARAPFTNALVLGLRVGAAYYLRVRAVAGGGATRQQSAWSRPVRGRTLPEFQFDAVLWKSLGFDALECPGGGYCRAGKSLVWPLQYRTLKVLRTTSPNFHIRTHGDDGLRRMSDSHVDSIRQALPDAVRSLTGKRYNGRITAGRSDVRQADWITIQFVSDQDDPGLWEPDDCGVAAIGETRGWIKLRIWAAGKPVCSPIPVLRHEVGHALGFYHVPGSTNLMNANIGNNTDFTTQEMHHAQLAYRLGPGYRYGDEPETTTDTAPGITTPRASDEVVIVICRR